MAGETRVRLVLSATDDASPKLRIVASTLNNIKSIAAGYVLATGLMMIGRGFREIAGEATEAAASLQQFTIGVETLIAREAVLSGKFDNIGDALRGTGGNVENLNNQLKELSLTSMAVFPVETIQGVWRLNMAYGATSEQSIDLTKAILSTSAALGLTTEMVQRLNYNLAQAVVAGDLTQINLRQLKLAGLDLARVLYEELGLSIQQIRDQLNAGQLTLREVSEAFVKYAEENFGGAAERMRNTFTGVQQALRNLFYWTGVDLLTPSLEAVTRGLNRILDAGQGILDSGLFAYIGQELGKMTEKATNSIIDFLTLFTRGFRDLPTQIYPAMEEIMAGMGEFGSNLALTAENAADEFGDSFGYKMGQVARSAFRWGLIIISELAAGLAEGAAATLVAVMNMITDLLTYWLSPGSPPRVAPDIDKWGAAAFTEWLHGFQEAEWDIFDSVQRYLEGAFRTLLDIGAIDEEVFGKEMIAYTMDLAKALEQFNKTGVLATGIYEKLREIGGEFGNELAKLLEKQFSLAKATEEYKRITEAFEAAAEAEKYAREELEKLTAEYDELVATRAPKILVRQKKAEMDVAKARHEAAEKEMQDLEDQRSEVEKRLDLLKEQARWQEKLIDQLRRMYEYQRMIDEAAEKALEKAKKIKAPKVPKVPKGAKGAEEEAMPEYPIAAFEPIGAVAKRTFDDIRAELKNLIPPEFDANIERIKTAFRSLKEPWEELKDAIGRVIDEKLPDAAADIEKLFPPELWKNIIRAAGAIGTFVAGFAIAKLAVRVGLWIFGLLGGKFLLLAVLLGILKTAWDNDWGGMRTTITNWWNETRPKLEALIRKLETDIPIAIDKLKQKWEEFKKWAMQPPEAFGPWLEETIRKVGEAMQASRDALREKVERGEGTWAEELLTKYWDIGKIRVPDVTGLLPKLMPIIGPILVGKDLLEKPISEAIEGVDWDGLATKVKTAFTTWWGGVGESIRETIPAFQLEEAWATFFMGLDTKLGEVGTKFHEWAFGVRDDVATIDLEGWIESTKTNLGNWAMEAAKYIDNFVIAAGVGIGGWIGDTQTGIGTWVTNTKTNIETWASETGEKFGTWKDDAITKFNEMGNNIKTWFETNIPAAWQAVVDFWDEYLYPCFLDLDTFIKDPVIETVKDLIDWFEIKLKWAWQVIVDFWNDHLKGAFEALKKILGAPTDSILFFLKEIVHWTEVRLKEAWEWVERAWNGTFGKVWRAIAEMMGAIKGALEGAVAAAKELINLIPQIHFPSIPGFGGQFGGYMMGGGLAQLHANEMVLPLGNQIGINALARAMEKAMKHGTPMGGYGGAYPIYINNLTVYAEDPEDLLGQLQKLSIPGRLP